MRHPQPTRTINIPTVTDAAIVASAKRQGSNPHAWIRQAIDERLAREQDEVLAACERKQKRKEESNG